MPNKVICFSSDTCAPCKQLKPELQYQADRLGFALKIIEMTRDNQEAFAKYGVRGVPTVVCVDENENEVGRFVGAQTPSSIESNLVDWGLAAN